jgi:hypothetical protein
MNPLEIITRLRGYGVAVRAEGQALLVEAASQPPDEALALVEQLKARKGEALSALTPWPDKPCFCCGETCWWLHRDGGPPVCGRCHPPAYPAHVRVWIPAAVCSWGRPCSLVCCPSLETGPRPCL